MASTKHSVISMARQSNWIAGYWQSLKNLLISYFLLSTLFFRPGFRSEALRRVASFCDTYFGQKRFLERRASPRHVSLPRSPSISVGAKKRQPGWRKLSEIGNKSRPYREMQNARLRSSSLSTELFLSQKFLNYLKLSVSKRKCRAGNSRKDGRSERKASGKVSGKKRRRIEARNN